jgi:uncharacterized protein with HEPN domain
MKREYLDYLQDMLDNAKRALQFIAGMEYKAFEKDEKTVYAVIRAVEIIGEAAKNVPPEVQKKYPNVPWRDISGMRDKLVHRYFGVNMEVVWQTVNEDLPFIIDVIANMIEKESRAKEGK